MTLTLEEWRSREHSRTLKRWLIIAAAVYLIFLIEPPLMFSRWRLVEINGQPVEPARNPMTLEFRMFLWPAAELSLGCNFSDAVFLRFSLFMTLRPRNITTAGCAPPDVKAQEEHYFEMLDAIYRYDVRRGILTLYTTDGQTLEYTRQ